MTAKKQSNITEFFYAGEVENLSRLSRHMLDYLCRHGLIYPSLSENRGFGMRRRFSFTDVLLARSIAALLAANVSVLNMRKSLKTLRDLLHLESASAATLSDKRIIIRGGTPFLSEPHRPPVDLTASGQMAFCFVLDVEDLWKRAETLQRSRKAASEKRKLRALELRRRRIA
jgi:DNA-binding transcriptional MerR regulator